MHPYLFEIPLPWGGTFSVPSYGAMMACGFLVCLWLLRGRGRRMGLDPLALLDVATIALIGGLVGARVFYVIDNWGEFVDKPWRFFAFWRGGLAFYGGLVGGTAALLGTVWKRRLPMRATLDVCASLLPLGHAFGRMGCFLNGCCYGKETEAWIGVRFTQLVGRSGVITDSPPVHPTQLYEIGYNLVIFALLSYLLPRRRRAGDIAWLYCILYGSCRFVNEFFRADTVPLPELGGLTLFQALSIGAVVFALMMLLDSRRRPPQPVPEPWGPPREDTRQGR